MSRRICCTLLASVAALAGFAASSHAQLTTVVPDAFTNTEGNSSSSTLFQSGAASLQVYFSEAFVQGAGIGVGDTITGLAFRRNGGGANGPAGDTTFASFNIFMSQSFASPASMTTTFANNVVGAQTQVRSGPLTVLANSVPGGATPNSFGTIVDFDTPYQYTGGSMLIEIRRGARSGDVTSFLTDVDNSVTAQAGGRWVFNLTSDAAATGTLSNSAQIFQLRFTPIPEPTGLALIGLASMGLCVRRRSS